MKLVVSGSRSIKDTAIVIKELTDYIQDKRVDLIVCGGAKGIDRSAMYWATINKIPFKVFYPNYELYGKIAPLVRNEKMAAYGNELLAIWDGKSRGTIHTVECFRKLYKPFKLIDMRGESRERADTEPQEKDEKDMADKRVEESSQGVH
jgi:hypothetical protein